VTGSGNNLVDVFRRPLPLPATGLAMGADGADGDDDADGGRCRCNVPVASMSESACVPPLKKGQGSFTVFTEGDELYEAMLASIVAARQQVRLESYMFADDEMGWRFAKALSQQARRGVRVRLHLDAAGFLLHGSRRLKRYLREQGVQVRLFHLWHWRAPLRYNRRNHRKLLVVDDRQMFLGGFNIHSKSSRALVGEQRWRDTHVSTSGPLVGEAVGLFDMFWEGERHWVPKQVPAVSALLPNHGRACRQILHCLYMDGLRGAKKSVYLTTPYFVPNHRTQRALRHVARNGVDVRLLVPAKNDVRLTQWAAREAYANLLRAGVRIYEYLPRMLHAKTAVVDGAWATIGTANLDYRSFFLNHELNLVTREPRLCRQMQALFIQDLEQAQEILPANWSKRPWRQHIAETVGWLARRWL
jgi:cardiolipin synthase A/B